MMMPGRKYSAGSGYRYGFNGKENDNEVKGLGNQIDFGDRIYDGRLGRWLSLDPLQKKYPSFSPYNFCINNPLFYQDIDGKDVGVTIIKGENGKPGKIIFSSTQYIDGVDAEKRAMIYQAAFNKFIEANPGMKTSDGKWNVEMQMTFKPASKADVERITNAKAESAGENLLNYVNKSGRAHSSGRGKNYNTSIRDYTVKAGTKILDKDLGEYQTSGNQATLYKNDAYSGNVTLHEVLHDWGLSDYYPNGLQYDIQMTNNKTGKVISNYVGAPNMPYEGYDGTIMGNQNSGLVLAQSNIDDLVAMALNVSSNNTKQGKNSENFTMGRIVDTERKKSLTDKTLSNKNKIVKNNGQTTSTYTNPRLPKN